MMDVREMFMDVRHGLMAVQVRVHSCWDGVVRMCMLMMLIMFVLMAMLYQLMDVLVLMGFSKV